MEDLCNKLRTLVQDCLAKHLYDSAIFYADKLTTMSDQAPRDAYLLAQAYYVGKQYRRSYALLTDSKLVEADIRCRYLAARCLANLKEWDDCLNIMGGDPGYTELAHMQENVADAEVGGELSYRAAMSLLRGQVYEAQENRIQAVRWYRDALRTDPFCYEAFKALVEGHMLTSDEEASLRESLRFREEDRWLHLLYRAKSKKHDQEYTMEATLAALEAPAPPPVTRDAPVSKQGTPQAPMEPLQPSTSARVNSHKDSDSGGMRTRSRAQRDPSPNSTDTVMQEDLPDEDAENSGKGGCGLGGNLDVALCRAGWHLHRGEYQACYALTAELLARDPYALEAMPVHLAAALELGKKNELFLHSHKLVEEYPEHVVAWFAVGCYYQSIGRYDSAQQYFGKATALDPSFAPAWLGFGHAFAAQDESDQAMAAYRTASRLFPGLHQPLLGMGCEYARMNNNALAEQVLRSAHAVCPQDPQPCHELGCLFYRAGDYPTAKVWLQKAHQQIPRPLTPASEPTIAALGHTFRKLRMFKEAAACFDSALSILPGQASTFAGLAYTYHLENRIQDAIDCYHKALALRPEDTLVAEMLTLAMQDSAKTDYSF